MIGLIGTVLLAAAVYISYTANNGLPLASTYHLIVEVPNANRLIRTDEVRIAGVRVGQVASVGAAVAAPGAPPYARVGLDLSPSAGPLAADTRVVVQSASILGATYVSLMPGRSHRRVLDGGTLPLANAQSAVQLTDLLDIFDRATARGIRGTLGELAAGLAGRGPALNTTLSGTAALLAPLTRVAANLAAPATALGAFLHGWESLAGTLAPVSAPLAGLFDGASTTFAALASVRSALGQTIDRLPGTEAAVTGALGRLGPPLNSLAALTVRLRAAGSLLPLTLANLNTTLSAGVAPLTALPRFTRALGGTLDALGALSRMQTTPQALRRLTDLLTASVPLLEVLAPAQRFCNVIGLWGRNFSSTWGTLSAGNGASVVNVGVVTTGANAEGMQSATPASNLHINYLPHETAAECEAGNEPFDPNRFDVANPPGNQSTKVPVTAPPPGVSALARGAGLLSPVPGATR